MIRDAPGADVGVGVVLKLLRGLTPRTEFIIVVVAAWAFAVFASIYGALTARTGSPLFSDADLKILVIEELVTMTGLAIFLHARGWTLERIGLGPTARETVAGIGLAIITYIAILIVWYAAALSFASVQEAGSALNPVEGRINPLVAIAVSIVNPIFEEVFLCGYLMTVLKDRFGTWTAINVSVGIRLVCHLYQGVVGVLAIVPIGLIFAGYFAHKGRLWPLIVAHILFDFFAFASFFG